MWPEALPAFGIIAGCVVITGMSLSFLNKWEHKGKPRRYGLDTWDHKMMQRDKRITGSEDVQKAL